MRLLVIIGVLNGLVPALDGLVEATQIVAPQTGSAHEASDPRKPPPEEGCTPTTHLCHCCASQAVVPAVRVVSFSVPAPRAPSVTAVATPHVRDSLSVIFRPPIA